ncbi:Pex19-domain-containing protein [Meredithblackwellia eburnea MCA 4105]
MAPPKIQDDEEDLDDLDNLIDEFNPQQPATSNSSTTSSSKPSKPVPSTSASPSSSSATAAAAGTNQPTPDNEDFPDPDDPDLDSPLSDQEAEEFTKQFQQSMNQLFASSSLGGDGASNLAGPADGIGPDLGALGLDESDMSEFQKMMEELLKGGAGEGIGDGADVDPAALLAALSGMPGMDGVAPGTSSGAKKSTKTKKKASAGTTGTGGPPKDFQSTINDTLSKMRDSSDAATASASTAANAEVDPMAAMMAQMAGLGDLGTDPEGLQGMLDEMMDQLMSRELLYEPLKELAQKYPDYLTSNASTLSTEDKDRYQRQLVVVRSIVAKFDEPGAEKDDLELDKLTAKEKEDRKRRREEVAELVKQMNDCGAPPSEIMGEMPEGMELGPDGVPKLPGDCVIS